MIKDHFCFQMFNLATLYVLEVEYGTESQLRPFQFELLNTYFYTDEFKKYARNIGTKYPYYSSLSWTETEPYVFNFWI